MKKLFTLLALCILGCLPSLSRTVYIAGTMTGWDTSSSDWQFTALNGDQNHFVFEHYFSSGTELQFKIIDDGKWTGGANKSMSIGQSNVFYVDGGDDVSLNIPSDCYYFFDYYHEWSGKPRLTVTKIEKPANLYIIGYIDGSEFSPSSCQQLASSGNGIFSRQNIAFTSSDTKGLSYFQFCENNGNSWETLGTRYGAFVNDTPFDFSTAVSGNPLSNTFIPSEQSFEVAIGFYDVTVNFNNMEVSLTPSVAVPSAQLDPDYNTVQSGEIEGYNITMTTNRKEVQLFIDVPEGTTPYYKLEQSGTVDQSSDGGYELMSLALDVPADYTEVPFDSEFSNKYAVVLKTGTTGTISLLYAKEVNGETVTSAPVKYTYSVNSGTPTAVEEIEGAEGGEAVYYNLQGTRVYNPERGIFIKVANGKTQKVIL